MTSNHSLRERAQELPIVRVRNVLAGYGGDPVLRDISFDVYRGEIVCLLGRSGCGKSTLFKVLVGLLPALQGEVTISGERIEADSEGGPARLFRGIGVLFQSGALFSSMTVAENVALPLRLHTKLPERVIERIVELKLAEVGLTGYETFLPAELSGGMQKRVGLARAMALDPKILFLDEPSAGLDPVTSAQLDDTMLRINQSLETTLILVTHELASVLKVGHRAIMLDRDERTIIASGPPHELRQSSTDPRVRAFFARESGAQDSD